ncbi:hypothetical protein [Undibacterium sp. Ji22W]|uniref:hypothetical protein n=1 Tax=Undibacterium sp. Ji22W TaxID=3413038 RepID=UPI003BF2405C
MSGNPKLRTNSPAHIVMCRLVDLGGCALIARLIEVLTAEQQRVSVIQERVICPLVERGFVILLNETTLKATQAGKDYAGSFLGRSLPHFERYVGQPAASRIAPSFRPLNLSKLISGRPIREGAFEYVSIPSMMGGGTCFEWRGC